MLQDPLVFGPNIFRIVSGRTTIACHYKTVGNEQKFVDFIRLAEDSSAGYSAKIAEYLEGLYLLSKRDYIFGVLVTPKIALRLYAEGTACPGGYRLHSETFSGHKIYVGRIKIADRDLALLIQDGAKIMWPENNSQWAVVNHSLLAE